MNGYLDTSLSPATLAVMIGDALALIEFLRKHYDEYHVVSALFDWEGNRIEGDKELTVEKLPALPAKKESHWFYRVSGPKDYVFVHMPVVSGLYADYPLAGQGPAGDASAFRYVNTPLSSSMKGGAANTQVSFIVYGYHPKYLLKAKQ